MLLQNAATGCRRILHPCDVAGTSSCRLAPKFIEMMHGDSGWVVSTGVDQIALFARRYSFTGCAGGYPSRSPINQA
ncbi:hypothetical protein ACFQZO_00010 [Bradyrhizobium sp. GCM10027634]|uniref:hypothetical protein n=1 Tax=Bradyrhizobium sp. CCBAU 53340 TaxID=1325112 RepID=UPI00188AFBA4|nr:hypothetical protein [Bradyrhizobium sp. CCBAU 53340]QOZ43788.1 hypothetical protein XH89_10060 [Bradyrhizobium sp. CCBAU 53340]